MIQPHSENSGMTFANTLSLFVHQQNQLQKRFGQWIAWGSLSLVFITALVVVLRYGFDSGSVALQEAVMYNHALLFMLGIAYTYQQDKHVRVDIFYVNASLRSRAWIDFLGTIFFTLPVMLFILWIGFEYVSASWRVLESSAEAGGIPYLYLLKSLMLVMALLVISQALAVAAQAWLTLFSAENLPDNTAPPSDSLGGPL